MCLAEKENKAVEEGATQELKRIIDEKTMRKGV
jgi:hypothetical protein